MRMGVECVRLFKDGVIPLIQRLPSQDNKLNLFTAKVSKQYWSFLLDRMC